jgi:hypothetical protein
MTTMKPTNLNHLGARLLGQRVPDLASALESLDRIVPLSPFHRAVLAEIGGAIVFDRGARFTTDESSPLNDKHGYQNLEVLYGPGNGKDSVQCQAARYAGELPPAFVPIGGAPGGNLICVDSAGAMFLWNHESPRDESPTRIAECVDQFLARLEPDESQIGDNDGIKESESFLDF